VLCAALLQSVRALAADALVLVVRTDSPIQALDSLTVRKAFIGLTVSSNGFIVRPLINATQPSLQAAFLQHVVGLSEQMYERRALTLALQQGLAQPTKFEDQTELLRVLLANPYAVTFMWQSTASGIREIRVIRTLWRE
jgi:hypothetical protein